MRLLLFRSIFLKCFLVLFLYGIAVNGFSQCATPLNPIATPYIQDFEANNGGWTTGGTASDWAWGTPNKPPYITSAGSGTKCWITGGLTGNSYNGGQLSWIQSPCFSFTAGSFPYVQFKVFWETELQYDGANFQYSLDNGITWTRVGSVSDPVDCINAFWYTYTPVRYITPPAAGSDGWAGSITTTPNNGSNGWKTAKHSMKYLAGKPQVIFRFVFASGTSFNNFAGFAIDSFVIKNAPPIGAQFTNTCTSNTTVQFADNSSNCPNKFLWNFGDPASGANNTSALPNPVHTFSGPGTYTVSLTASDVNLNHSFGSATRPITILSLSNSVVTPITCAGENNGSIALNVTGPVGFYTYTWNTTPVSNSATIGLLSPATYTVNVLPPVNPLGITCPFDTSFTLIAPPPVAAPTVGVNQPGCTISTGDITITNPTSGYTYSIDSGATYLLSPVFTGLLPGIYYVMIKNNSSCKSTAVMVTINPAAAQLPEPITTLVQPNCNSVTGSITVTNPTTGVTYSFDGGATFVSTPTSGPLVPNDYAVLVKNAAGCVSDTAFVTINLQPDSLDAPFVSIQQTTCTISTGIITVTYPTTGITYSFNGGASFIPSSISPALPIGTYNVVVKDTQGCLSFFTEAVINDPPPLLPAPTTTILQPTCTVATGTITVSNPASGVTYSFNNGVTFQASSTSLPLLPGNYNVIIKNAAGCLSDTTFDQILPQPDSLNPPIVSIVQPVCSSPTGTITVTSPTIGYVYSFDNGANFQAGATSPSLLPGIYKVMVKSVPDNCLSYITEVEIFASPSGPAAPTISVTQPTCFTATGIITVTSPASGVTYSFDNGVNFQSSATSLPLVSNTYQVVVKDAGNCVSQPTSALINPQPVTPVAPTTSVTQPTCSVSTGTITVTVPTSGVTYSFDNGLNFGLLATSTSLLPNTYQVIVKNTDGCISASTPTIINTQPTIPSTPVVTVVQPNCTVSTGTLTVISPASGVTYSFDNGVNFQPLSSASVAAGNTYQVIVKNAAGCLSASTSASVNAQLPIPALPAVTIVHPTCAVSTGTISVINAVVGDLISFDNGVNYSTATSSGNLSAGTYQVIIKNAAGCTGSVLAATINNQPQTPLAPTTTVIQPTCTVSTGTITVTQPVSGVTYSFDNGSSFQAAATSLALTSNTYQVIVKNTSGCSSGATATTINLPPAIPATPVTTVVQPTCTVSTGTITVTSPAFGVTYSFDNGVTFQGPSTSVQLSANTYQVVVMNSVGCKSSSSTAVINAQPFVPVAPSVSVLQPTCTLPTGVITVTVPASGVTYSFDNGVSFQPGPSSPALSPALYNVIVKSTSGCISSATPTVINLQPLSPATPVITVVQPNCTVSTGTITVTSPLTGVTYSFDNGITFQNSNVSNTLPANIYQVIVKNAAGCLSTASTATINIQPQIPAAPSVNSPVIYCQNKPSIALSATGIGLLWYTSPTAVLGSTIAPIPSTTNPGNTVYYVSQTNATCEGPRAAITVTVNAIPAAPVLLKDTVVNCQFSTALPLMASATGTLCWLANCIPGTCASTVIPPTSTVGFSTYCVTQSVAGCESPAALATVHIITAPDLGPDKTAQACFGGNINLLPLYDTTGYDYEWTYKGYPFASPDSVAIPGTFTLIVKSIGGCTDSADVVVTILPKVMAYAGGDTTAIVDKPTQLHASGGGPGGTYLWSTIPSTSNAIISNPTDQHPFVTLRNFEYTFEVLVANILGCTDRDTMKVMVLQGPQYYVPNAFTPGGINNLFRPVPVGVPTLDYFKVFNRFGEQVYSTNKFMDGWDGNYKGQPQSVGTYVWLLQGKDINGRVIKMNGTVVLIR